MTSTTSRTPGIRTVAGGFLLYGALFTDRLAPLFLAERIGIHFDVEVAALGLLPFAIAVGWTVGLGAGRLAGRRLSLRQRLWVGGSITALAGLASVLAPSYAVFLTIRLLGGVGANIASPALIALVVRATPLHRRGAALGVLQSSTRVAGSFLAPIVLTLVVAAAGWRPAVAVAAATIVLVLLPAMALLPRQLGPSGTSAMSRPPTYRPGGGGLIALAAVTAVLTMLWLVLMSQGGVPLLEQWLGLEVAAAGRLLAWFGIGGTFAAVAVPSWSDRSRSLALAGASLATAISGGVLGVAALLELPLPLPAVAACIGLAGIGLGGLPLAISVLPADAVAEGDVDRAVEVPIISAELLGGALLPAIAFAVITEVGMAGLILTTAASFLLLAVIGAPLLARNYRVNAPARPGTTPS